MNRFALACLLTGCFTKPPEPMLRDDGSIVSDVRAPTDADLTGTNVAFVTSGVWSTTNLGSITGADQKCAAAALQGNLQGTFKAWISDDTTSAVARFTAFGTRGWIRRDGAPFADSVTDLAAGRIYYPLRRNENADDFGRLQVLTGTSKTGAIAPNCDNLMGGGTEAMTTGYSDRTTEGWTDANQYISCGSTGHLYCLQIDHVRPVTVMPAAGRLAFLSANTWTPGAGLASADALCTTEAGNAGRSGNFAALLATSAQPAAQRFNIGTTWVRPDGVALAATALAVLNLQLDAPLNVTLAKAYVGAVLVWTGMQSQSSLAGVDTCNDWNNNTITFNGAEGVAASSGADAHAVQLASCNSPAHVYCLQL